MAAPTTKRGGGLLVVAATTADRGGGLLPKAVTTASAPGRVRGVVRDAAPPPRTGSVRWLARAPSSPLHPPPNLAADPEEEAPAAAATTALRKRGATTHFTGSGGYTAACWRILRDARNPLPYH